MKTSKSHAKWQGTLKNGNGNMKLGSMSQEFPYNFSSRFEDGDHTNPEELIAAAHAGCFSMAFSGLLGDKDYEVKSISTDCKVTIEKNNDGFKITKSELKTEAEVPGIDEELFVKLANEAKQFCPVSQALKSVQISLDASLKS